MAESKQNQLVVFPYFSLRRHIFVIFRELKSTNYMLIVLISCTEHSPERDKWEFKFGWLAFFFLACHRCKKLATKSQLVKVDAIIRDNWTWVVDRCSLGKAKLTSQWVHWKCEIINYRSWLEREFCQWNWLCGCILCNSFAVCRFCGNHLCNGPLIIGSERM